jgi:hypothetical protein
VLILIIPNIIKRDRFTLDDVDGASSTHGRESKCVQDLVGQLEGKRPLGRARRKGEIIKMGHKRSRMGRWTGFNWRRAGTSGGLL